MTDFDKIEELIKNMKCPKDLTTSKDTVFLVLVENFYGVFVSLEDTKNLARKFQDNLTRRTGTKSTRSCVQQIDRKIGEALESAILSLPGCFSIGEPKHAARKGHRPELCGIDELSIKIDLETF